MKKRVINKNTKAYAKKLEKRELKRLDEEWRTKVKEEWGNACAICKRRDVVHCHHLIPRTIKSFRHNVENGICLCANHHKWSLECSPHMNPLVFYHWYMNNYKNRYEKLFIQFYSEHPFKSFIW